MINNSSIKVYNKADKLKLHVDDSKNYKVVSIYKYDEEKGVKELHSFIYEKEHEYSVRNSSWRPYYEFYKEVKGVTHESLVITDERTEHWKVVGDNEHIKTRTESRSGNVYEKRIKTVGEDIYISEFVNGEFENFNFKIQENKIKEYLKIVENGR